MILDSLASAELYHGLHPRFAEAFEFLHSKCRTLPDGVYEISGREVYCTISTVELRTANEAPLEAHDKYIDIQLVMQGSEAYGFAPRAALRQVSPASDSERDLVFFDDPILNLIPLKEGQFVVFFPTDAHAPLIGEGVVRKAIVKVKCQ